MIHTTETPNPTGTSAVEIVDLAGGALLGERNLRDPTVAPPKSGSFR